MPWGRKERGPKDTDGLKIANCLLSPNEFRSYLTQTVYKVNDGNNPIGFQEDALPKIIAEEDSFKKLTKAIKNHEIKALTFAEQIIEATQKGMFTDEQAEAMIEAENLRNIIIAVDDFDMSELARNSLEPKIGKNQEQLKQKDNNDQQSLHEKVG
jgi:acyl-CoA dehydrogenase